MGGNEAVFKPLSVLPSRAKESSNDDEEPSLRCKSEWLLLFSLVRVPKCEWSRCHVLVSIAVTRSIWGNSGRNDSKDFGILEAPDCLPIHAVKRFTTTTRRRLYVCLKSLGYSMRSLVP